MKKRIIEIVNSLVGAGLGIESVEQSTIYAQNLKRGVSPSRPLEADILHQALRMEFWGYTN
ncbi:MAG TPA: hypothetical protein V6C95_10070 [Coleofasciculaceae cyanobacterium]